MRLKVNQKGRIYNQDTHEYVRAVVKDIYWKRFIALDENGNFRAFNLDGSGVKAFREKGTFEPTNWE